MGPEEKANIIVVTGFPSIESSVRAVKLGAIDDIEKPFDHMGLKRKKSILQGVSSKSLYFRCGVIEIQ